jgi:hypothetical protein
MGTMLRSSTEFVKSSREDLPAGIAWVVSLSQSGERSEIVK